MREKACKVMALCDTEEEYAQLMTEFMRKQKNLPWELHTYTNVDTLLAAAKKTHSAANHIIPFLFVFTVPGHRGETCLRDYLSRRIHLKYLI